MNIYFMLGGLLVALASYAGTFYVGASYGEDKQLARAASTQEIVAEAVKARDGQFAVAVDGIEQKRQVITQKVTHEVQTNTIYADCKHTDSMLSTVNEALTGRPDASPASELPKADTSPGSKFWGNHPKISGPGLTVPKVPK